MTWAEVDQAPRITIRHRFRAPVRMALTQRRGGHSTLWITFSKSMLEKLGWQVGGTIGLSIGADKFDGWLRLSPSRHGRILQVMGKKRNVFTIPLAAPAAWHGFTCASTVCEQHRIQGAALLIQIPWDFSEAETGTGPAGHEVHS